MKKVLQTGVLFLIVLYACDDPVAPVATVESLSIDSAGGPLIRVATVTLDRPGDIRITYGAAGTPLLTIESAAPALTHTLVLPRLRAARTYAVEVSAVSGRGAPAFQAGFTTGALPADIAPIQFTVTGTPALPVAFVEVVGSSTGFLGLLIVENGEIVWYQRSSGSLFGSTRRSNGDIVLLDGQLGLVSYRLDGTIAHRLPQPATAAPTAYGRIHHDAIATPHNTILFIANETRTVNGVSVIGEALWEWTPETEAVVKRWSAFDHLSWPADQGPRSSAENWLHGNGLAYGPRGNVIFSMRNADQVLSIAPDFTTVEWRFGGVGSTLSVAAEDLFYGQHGIMATGPDRLLVFDNGFDRPGFLYSRAIEYRIDTVAKTVERLWQYRATPDIYAPLVGSAKRLDDGNTVLLFGMRQDGSGATGPIVAMEVTPAGNERWRLLAGPQITRLYRVTPVASLLGEVPANLAE